MKKKILIWFVLPILVQFLILFYINNIFLTSGNIDIKKINENSDLPKKIKVKFDYSANDLSASYDGKYVSFLNDGKIFILNSKNSDLQKIIDVDDGIVEYYTWLPDRDRILYFYKKNLGYEYEISLVAYDFNNFNYMEVGKIYVRKGEDVKNVTLSTLTNMIYVNIVNRFGDSMLYRIDIMGQFVRVSLPFNRIIRMSELRHKDQIFIQSSDGRIYLFKNMIGSLFLNRGYEILGIGADDTVYIGKVDNDNVTKVFVGKTDEPFHKWREINLEIPVNTNSILIFPKNNEIGLLRYNNEIKILSSGKIISPEGKYICHNENYIIYKNPNEVILKLY
ncbi:hypothetical protein Thena_1057 [Thermodesulfobium narugense DSM 14796]|uniref:Dipeptidylpeptidase IV N-terminal domain-containing protein n=1 Tax=Thermodesulfobium narugense DSM 14796 TaxID=747365 RepID=M1E8U7_9BACT|nr:hypothetical protein [Thermodesulfobium narugense]AEE14684.1 hypothetical protein Thena_1057 [Thermodesulfobium narugense DSM 14796]